MEQVTIEEAQERLADLMTAAANGETVIIVGEDAVPFQIVRLPTTETYLGNDGIRYYLSRGELLDAAAGVVYYPNVPEPPTAGLQPGSAEGQIWMAEDFDAPLDEYGEETK
jgi:antitoxin (DNA-binding transcriptional repressor) of toxin-antitoxin stability system